MKIRRELSATIILLATAVAAHAEGLCATKEKLIFNCELEKSLASLCQSTENGALIYRNGSNGKLSLQVSDDGKEKNLFYFSNTPYAGGGEAHIRFYRMGYTYYLYDRVVKSDDGPMFTSGIVIYKGKNKISNRLCSNDASIRESAYHAITREEYQSIDAW